MHGKSHYRVMIMFITALLVLMSGCTGKQNIQEEELTELTDTMSEEVPEEAGEGTKRKELQKEEQQKEPKQDEIKTADGTAEIYVHVCGRVANPGVYKFPAGSRMFEAIEAAGGYLEDAADEWLNQAAQVEDGQQIYVPSKEEAAQGLAGQNVSNLGEDGQIVSKSGMTGSQNPLGQGLTADDGKIDLNTASREQLMTLRGIGEAKADSIIAYREEHGGFQKIEELMEVEGIKEGIFNKVKDQIKVS